MNNCSWFTGEDGSSKTWLNLQMAASFLGLLPPLVITIALQGYLKRGISVGAAKG